MSEENVEIVRLATEPHNGEDMVPILREVVDGVYDWSDTEVVAAFANDPDFRPMHPEVEWTPPPWDLPALTSTRVYRDPHEALKAVGLAE